MTASDAKPFYATKFMKMNKLQGNMFNYWTEGGAIAFGQEPDPKTGFTPLQLFMDGRAQAAYDRGTFDRWTGLTSGGPVIQSAARKARALEKSLDSVLTPTDRKKAGEWLSKELKKHDVWVILMPAGQFEKPFTRSIEYARNWALVFVNNKQKLFVDVDTPQGKALFSGIFTGNTLYPDEFHKNMAYGHHLLNQPDPKQKIQGFEKIKQAFNTHPSPAPMLQIMLAVARFPDHRGPITEFLTEWTNKFAEKQDEFRRQDGYRLKLEATRIACYHLKRTAEARKDLKLAKSYEDRQIAYATERNQLSLTKRG
jgi:hypothetical protein